MEAAACYIGEAANPDHDAKIAMNFEGGYGVFIYTLVLSPSSSCWAPRRCPIPLWRTRRRSSSTSPSKVFPGVGGEFLDWVIATMLIVALALSALNAIMGFGRSLYQMALDGEFPLWFTKINDHGVPARAMAFNVSPR